MVIWISKSLLEQIAAMIKRAMHNPTVAFQVYLDENPWSLEARVYDV